MPLHYKDGTVKREIDHLYYKDGTAKKLLDRIYAKVGSSKVKIFENKTGPTINSFTSNPASVNLSSSPPTNITLSFALSGSVATRNRITDDTGRNIRLTTNTTAVIARPARPTTYTLISENSAGRTQRDLLVNVTYNASIGTPRRTNYIPPIPGVSGAIYYFWVEILGMPKPVVTYWFTGGIQGTLDPRLIRNYGLISNNNGFGYHADFHIAFPNANARLLRMTATNAGGSVTSTLTNINS